MKTVSHGVLTLLAQEAARRGFDAYATLQAEGVAREAFDDIEARIPLSALDHALERIASPDPTDFALSAIRNGALAGRAYYAYLTANAANVGDYLDLTLRFGRLLTDGALLRAQYETHSVMVDQVMVEPATRPPAALYVARVAWMAGFVFRARMLSGGVFLPDAVRIAAPPPRVPHPLAALFGVEPELDASVTSLQFPRAALALPFPRADATLRNVLAVRAQAMLDALPQLDDVHGHVKNAVHKSLRTGDASLTAVARALGMAPRTLQERLHLAGISFRRVVDESRMELALEYLDRGELRVADIAYSLGFESPSAFARWYRRSTGHSPAGQRGPLKH
jgi:AraC-like DNA-binding protein